MTMTKDILKGFLLLIGFGVTLASEESSSTLLISDYDASTMAEIEDVVITNKTVTDGAVLVAKQELIAKDLGLYPYPDSTINIQGTGVIYIGDADTTGQLSFKMSSKNEEGTTASISNVRISVTQGVGEQVDVKIGRLDEISANATIANTALDLSTLQENVSFTVDNATISAAQVNQPTGSIYLVNHAGMSLVSPSQLHNLYVDSTSNFFGSTVSAQVKVSGRNTVELTPQNGAGNADAPLLSGKTVGCYQLYGLTFEKEADLTLDMNNVFVGEELLEKGGEFKLYFNGVKWQHLDVLTDLKYITDTDLLNSTFVLDNFKEIYGEDFADRLLITSAYYLDGDFGLVLNISVLPIPEPATATLSILALAGLAARRRRK